MLKMWVKYGLPAFIFTFINVVVCAQEFKIENSRAYYKQQFNLVGGLVIVPVKVNGTPLSFIIDSGFNSTIIFSVSSEDSLDVKNASRIYLRGLGTGKPITAIKSAGNEFRIGEVVNPNQDIYIIQEEFLGISNRLGVPVNGIIGYDLFKSLVIDFNYRRELMKIYTPESYSYKNCRPCEDLPLEFRRNKAYLNAVVVLNGKPKTVKLLFDSGSSDALWLFPEEEEKIEVSEKSFKDYLGFGISGSVYGNRGRIDKLKLGSYTLEEVTTSFPDTAYIADVVAFTERNGSLGGEVLKRFRYVVDYTNKNLRIKPNSNFGDAFEYDMSGLVIQHNGRRLVKNLNGKPTSFSVKQTDEGGIEVYSSNYEVKFSLEPQYEIAEVRPDSPAEKAGIKTGDFILELNRKPVYKYSLSKISAIFTSREGRNIRLLLERDGKEFEVKFKLERIL